MNRSSLILLVLVLTGAISVVAIRHENRLAFIELQDHERTRGELQTEWGRLVLEKSTWGIEHNIADDAGNRLSMFPPAPEKIVTVHLDTVQ